MRMTSTFILLMSLMLSCSKSKPGGPVPPVVPPVVNTNQPVQYGTPFANVPDPDEAIIYQVNIRAFSLAGNLQGVTDRLDSIKNLGANVIYLMPVYPVGITRSVNSPYCVRDYNSVATEYGTLSDLRNFVDAAHQRNIAVIMDWVANHTSWDNPWIANKTWYRQDGAGNIISPPNTGWNDVAALNYGNAEMRKAMITAMKSWVYSANIDGYRCDAADFIPADFWKQAIDSLRSINSHRLIMLAEGTRTDHFASGFQMIYGMGFYYNLKNYISSGGPVTSIDSVNNAEYRNANSNSQVVRYLSNHDVDLSDGTPSELFGGNSGALTSFVVAAYMKGIPMIYCGQEIGYNTRLNYFNNSTPINWIANPAVTSVYKKIIEFRKNSEAIKTGNLVTYSTADVCAFIKTSGGEKVLVIANMRANQVVYNLPASISNSSWTNAFDASIITLSSQLTLDAHSFLILKN